MKPVTRHVVTSLTALGLILMAGSSSAQGSPEEPTPQSAIRGKVKEIRPVIGTSGAKRACAWDESKGPQPDDWTGACDSPDAPGSDMAIKTKGMGANDRSAPTADPMHPGEPTALMKAKEKANRTKCSNNLRAGSAPTGDLDDDGVSNVECDSPAADNAIKTKGVGSGDRSAHPSAATPPDAPAADNVGHPSLIKQ